MPKLRQVHIENFRCLRNVDLDFEPMTILVGPNASGKTTLLDALAPRLAVVPESTWQQRHSDLFVQRWGQLWEGAPFRDHTRVGSEFPARWTYRRIQLLPNELRQLNRLNEERQLARTGSNLANVFATLPRSTQAAVARQLCELIPLYGDVDVRPSQQGHHRLIFQDRWTPSLWYEPGQVSDGTMILLAFLVLTHTEEPPDILAVEEPEYALHPFLLGRVIGMLRDLALGKLGPRAVQVILATHSAELLNFARPEEVRFLSRSLEDGSTQIRKAPTETEEWKTAFAEYEESLGELWLSGGMGGVPGASAAQ